MIFVIVGNLSLSLIRTLRTKLGFTDQSGFLAIAVLFNPVVPIARSGRDVLWLNGFGLAAFLTAAVALKAEPARTVLSITSHLPRRESL